MKNKIQNLYSIFQKTQSVSIKKLRFKGFSIFIFWIEAEECISNSCKETNKAQDINLKGHCFTFCFF